jgi:DNA-binding FadR family transcriptional regulator
MSEESNLVKLEKIEIVSIQRETLRRIKDYLIQSGLVVGDPIPTEKQLAESIGVSRTAVREALKGLESLGLIEVRPGIGRFMRKFDIGVLFNSLELHITSDSEAFRELFEIRRCLETSFIVPEVAKFNEEDIQELESIIQQVETQIREGNEDRSFGESHVQFHNALFKRSGNKMLIELTKIFSALNRRLASVQEGYKDDPEEFLHSHRQIIAALKTRDPAAVSKAVYDHFTHPAAW